MFYPRQDDVSEPMANLFPYVVFQNWFLESESKETNFNRKEVDVGMVQPSDCIKLRPAPGVMEDEH